MKGFFVLLLLFPIFAFAQTPSSIDSIEVHINPEIPKPGETVTIKVESFLTDLNKATISWSVNGKVLQSGIGKASFSFVASKSTVVIGIKTIEGRTVQRTINIHPADVSITYEPIGYTPPLYKGKSLPAYQSAIRFVAVPNVNVDPDTLVYTWKKNSTVLGNDSGYGKQSVVISGTVIPEPMTISVTIQSKDGKVSGEGAVSVDFYQPEIQFYKEDPLYGVFSNKALKNLEPLLNNELKILAVPYFFTDISSFNWLINGTEKPDLSSQKSILFRNNNDVAGQSNIELEIRGKKNILQSARKDFTVYFNKKDEKTN